MAQQENNINISAVKRVVLPLFTNSIAIRTVNNANVQTTSIFDSFDSQANDAQENGVALNFLNMKASADHATTMKAMQTSQKKLTLVPEGSGKKKDLENTYQPKWKAPTLKMR